MQPFAGSQVSSLQPLPSSQMIFLPALHLLAAQMSPLVQASLSSQLTVFAALTQPPTITLQLSSVHKLLSSQFFGLPVVHAPPAQVSPTVQTLPSSHGSLELVNTQPLSVSQLLSVHGLPSSQMIFSVPAHTPLAQKSFLEQATPSSQGNALSVCLQPVMASQSSVVHNVPSSQLVAVPGKQMPPAHKSGTVQALLSLHGATLFVKMQPFLASQVSSVQTLPSLQTMSAPGMQTAAPQVSPLVQALPSSQGAVLFSVLQPPAASQVSVVHGLPSSQGLALSGLQKPLLQMSPSVQLLKSSQANVLNGNTQPVNGSQVSSVHKLPSAQDNFAVKTQMPSLHTSPNVQLSLSLQALTLLTCAQPLTASQLSVVQGLLSLQLVASPDKHTLFLQWSPLVHSLASLQIPLSSGVDVQPVAMSQASALHGFLSSQTLAAPAAHLPSLQASSTVQALPSSQVAAPAKFTQLPSAPQESTVQTILSSQSLAFPALQAPAAHVSPAVHALPSSQAEPSGAGATAQNPSLQTAVLHAIVIVGHGLAAEHAKPTSPKVRSTNCKSSKPSENESVTPLPIAFLSAPQAAIAKAASAAHTRRHGPETDRVRVNEIPKSTNTPLISTYFAECVGRRRAASRVIGATYWRRRALKSR